MTGVAGDLVWLASYPKSGNTWFRLLLANLLSEGDAPVGINAISLPGGSAVNHVDIGSQTLIDTDLLTAGEADSLRPRMIDALLAQANERRYVKLHDAFRTGPDGEPLLGLERASGAFYLVRDPRDLVVSLAHHSGYSIDEAIQQLNARRGAMANGRKRRYHQVPQFLGDWGRHVRSWTRQSWVPVHVIRYEDLLADTIATFSQAVRFIGIDAEEERIERAVRFSAFGELQRQERADPFLERWEKASAPFFRSGRAGAWPEVLSAEQCAAIEKAHGAVMRRFGYDLAELPFDTDAGDRV